MTSLRRRRLATWMTRTSRAVEWETRMSVDTSEVLKILAVQGMATCIRPQATGGLWLSSDPGDMARCRGCAFGSPLS